MNRSVAVKRSLDLSSFANTRPCDTLRFLFIHHSCGGHLLAAPGPDNGTHCIYVSNPNAGDLRAALERNAYEVHEASYGSALGENTDIFDWLPKFRDKMERVLACRRQDESLTDGARNNIVAFKSCFSNNFFLSEGRAPGNPAGPVLTLWNAKAAYSAMLNELRKYPNVLFVCFTTPPLAFRKSRESLCKVLARRILCRKGGLARSGGLAREFSNWLADTNGWLKDYPLKNVVVFNYYDILTGNGASDFCFYPTGDGGDSHPSSEGNRKAAEAFVPFLNGAVRRANLVGGRDNDMVLDITRPRNAIL